MFCIKFITLFVGGGFVRDVTLWSFSGFSLVSLGGTILHFLYDWTNESLLIAPFSGVNESTWEHMKLLFFPLFIFALFQSFFFKEYKNFWWIKLFSTLLGLALPAYWQAMLYSRVFDQLEGVERTLDGEIIDDGWRMDEEAPIDSSLIRVADETALPEISEDSEEEKKTQEN